MFVGHLAVALGAKRIAPHTNLAWLIAGVITLDLVWPVLLLVGVERVSIAPGATAFTPFVFEWYPWSHSLVMAVAWGGVLAALARWRRVPGPPLLFVALVVSHWVLDAVTHAPDMPLWPGSSPRVGLGLWNSIPATLIVEGAMWAAGIAAFVRGWPPQSRSSRLAWWSFVVVATILWVSGPWATPPPSATALGWFALVSWALLPWAGWADPAPDLPRRALSR